MLVGAGAFAFIMGLISGYPVGAKIAANLRENNLCSKEECERLLSFTNNSGPLFIIGTVGISMFGSYEVGLLLFVTHFLSSILVGFIFRFWKAKNYRGTYNNSSTIKFSNLGEIIAESINSSISTILMIGGFIIVFSSVISILNSSGVLKIATVVFSPLFSFFNIDSSFITGLFSGIFEITNGISIVSSIHIPNISVNLVFTSFLLGFGGLSVMLQVLGIISKTDLSFKPYVLGKVLHGVVSSFLTWIIIDLILHN